MLMSVLYSLRLRVGLQSPELVLLAMFDALRKITVGFGFLSTYFPRGRLFLDLKMLIHSKHVVMNKIQYPFRTTYPLLFAYL